MISFFRKITAIAYRFSASKASKLKTPPPTRATRKDLQLPAAKRLKVKFNSPKKMQLFREVIWVPLAQGRSCLSLCNQHLYWPGVSKHGSTKRAAVDNPKGNWLIYLFRSRWQQIKSPNVFAIQTESKDGPGCLLVEFKPDQQSSKCI